MDEVSEMGDERIVAFFYQLDADLNSVDRVLIAFSHGVMQITFRRRVWSGDEDFQAPRSCLHQ